MLNKRRELIILVIHGMLFALLSIVGSLCISIIITVMFGDTDIGIGWTIGLSVISTAFTAGIILYYRWIVKQYL